MLEYNSDYLYDELRKTLKNENVSDQELGVVLALLDELQTTYTHIQDGRSQLVSALDAVNIPVFLLDSELIVLRANKSYANISGMEIRNVVGTFFWEGFPLSQSCFKEIREQNKVSAEITTSTEQVFLNHNYPVHDKEGHILYTLYVLTNITQQKYLETEHQHSKALFSAMAYSATDAIIMLESDGKISYWNHAAELMFGYSKKEAIGVAIEMLIIPENFREKYTKGFASFLLAGKGDRVGKTVVISPLRKDGSEFYAEISISAINYKEKWQALGVVRDISERMTHVKQLDKLNGTLNLMRKINHILTHTSDEHALIKSVCRSLSEHGGYSLAWVGYAQEETEKKTVSPIPSYRADIGYLDGIKVTTGDDVYTYGPTETAIRTNLPIVVNDIATYPHYELWRKETHERSFRSFIALPLFEDDQCFGALNIYASEPNTFNWEIQDLLSEMANDLAFSIASIRQKLRSLKHEEQLNTLIEKNPDAIIILDNEHCIEFANKAAETLLGKKAQKLLGKNFGFPAIAGEISEVELLTKNSKGESEIRTAELYVAELSLKNEQKTHVFLHDVTERKVAEKLSSRMGYLLAHSWNELYVFDANTLLFCEVSSRAQKSLGYTLEELKKMTPLDLKSKLTLKEFKALLLPLRSNEVQEVHFESEHQCKDGSIYPVEVRLQFLDKEYPHVFMGIVQNVSERKKHLAELEYKAFYDGLTGLLNRHGLLEHLEKQCNLAKEKKTQVALYSVKALNLKEINDLFGYGSGDRILQEIATRLQELFAQSTMAARSGDNIFSIVLSYVDSESLSSISEKIHLLFQKPFNDSEIMMEIEFCLGLALYSQHEEDAEQLLRNSYNAMHRAQQDGVSSALFTSEDTTVNVQKIKYHGELREAIQNRELVLYFQPQVDMKSGHIVSVEALARWPHKEHGMVYPSVFIPIIEQSTLIHPFTKWVLEEAVLQLSRWRDEGVELSIAVNLSAKNLLDASLPNYIADLLHTNNIDVEKLSLEITESALMTRPDEAMKIIMQLKKMGFNLSLDDFGTGYSSLYYLQKLPIHELKIDQSFVFGLLKNDEDAAIVGSTIDLANNLKLVTVAEGVETQALFERLLIMNCHIAQGYYMAKPLSIEDLTLWLRESPFGLGNLSYERVS